MNSSDEPVVRPPMPEVEQAGADAKTSAPALSNGAVRPSERAAPYS